MAAIICRVSAPDRLRELLLTPEEAAAMDAPGKTDAAVLVPLFERAGELAAVFTERRHDLRRHAGEISFPGGRQDSPTRTCARPRCARPRRRSGCAAANVELVGALPPVGTFVTGYRVFPFVGWIEAGHAWAPQETRGRAGARAVAARAASRGYECKRLITKGVPIKTPTYTVDGHLVWGATGRIAESLLERLRPDPEA